MNDASRAGAGPKRILVADPVGDTGRIVTQHAADWGAEVRVFEQPGLLARSAAHAGADLCVIVRPESLEFLEKLHNEPQTRHIPLILCSGTLSGDPERAFLALDVANQVLSYPYDPAMLVPWIGNALKRDFRRGTGQEFAEARMRLDGTARWTGRVSWVSGNRLRLETDLVPAEGEELVLEGPLLRAVGEPSAVARVVSRSKDDLHYDREVRLVLDVQRARRGAPLSALVRGNAQYSAPGKLKIAVIAPSGNAVARLADAVDTAKFTLRWIESLEGLSPRLQKFKPALLVADPEHPDLHDTMRAGALVRAAKAGIPVLPLAAPGDARFWDRLGPLCPQRDVPPVEPQKGWTALLLRHAVQHETDRDPDRVFLRRDHPFSHARIVTPATLTSLTEAAGSVECPFALGERARARIDVPDLEAAGVKPLYGRVLRAARAKERAPIVWMGVGDEDAEKRLRFFVYEAIIAQRRKDLEA